MSELEDQEEENQFRRGEKHPRAGKSGDRYLPPSFAVTRVFGDAEKVPNTRFSNVHVKDWDRE